MQTDSSDCFTYQQLADFATGNIREGERILLQQHLMGCELCGFAVKGFVHAPFSLKEVADINEQIEKRVDTSGIPVRKLKYISMAGIAVLLIFSFYSVVSSFEREQKFLPQKAGVIPAPSFENEKEEKYDEAFAPAKIRKKTTRNTVAKLEEKRELYELFPLQPVQPLIEEAVLDTIGVHLQPVYMAEAVYIYNLKVANYFELYFKISGKKTVGFNNHIPSFDENKNLQNQIEDDISKTMTLESVLKKGLFYFNEENYENSISQFQELLMYSPGDINAFFYLAMAHSKAGHYGQAAKNFNKVLNHPDKTFDAEAKWHLALVYIATDETDKAKCLLEEIVSEKGFYAENAERKLAGIRNQ